jgi:hypothetical protein
VALARTLQDPSSKMKPFMASVALAICLATSVHAVPTALADRTTTLKHWPEAAAAALDKMIVANANQSNYAVFDMDNTSYQFDLEESLLPFLENRGILTRRTMDASLKLIDFKDSAEYTETLFSYYYRLCEVDDLVCYPWYHTSDRTHHNIKD